MRYYAVGKPIHEIENSYLGNRLKTLTADDITDAFFSGNTSIRLFMSFDDAKEYANYLQSSLNNFQLFTNFLNRTVLPVITLDLNPELFKQRGLYSELISFDMKSEQLYFYTLPMTLISRKNIIRAEFCNSQLANVEFNESQTNCALF